MANNQKKGTTTDRANDEQWTRRKAWPLLLGSAAVIGGASAANYAWANPDGKLTSKAQSALSAKYPGATVRVHGRDAIITGLPDGADPVVAHDLVREIEGVRNVKEEAGGAAVGEATTTVAPTTVAPTTVVATTVAPTTVVATTVVATVAPSIVAPTTEVSSTDTPMTTIAAPAASEALSPTTAPPPVKILFEATSSLLAGETSVGVDQLAAYLQGNPDVRIKVVGHADNYGTRLTNLAISRARADAVIRALIDAGIDRSRMSAAGHGDRLPVASNATKAGRRANRRVEIVYFGAEGTAGREVAFTG